MGGACRFFRHQPLNPESIAGIRAELAATQAYEAEIADEAIPDAIRQKLAVFGKLWTMLVQQYDKVRIFWPPAQAPVFICRTAKPARMSLLRWRMRCNIMQRFRNWPARWGAIFRKKKQCARIPQTSKSEVHGTHRSDDLMRVLPSELLNLEDDTLETCFARLPERIC